MKYPIRFVKFEEVFEICWQTFNVIVRKVRSDRSNWYSSDLMLSNIQKRDLFSFHQKVQAH